MRQEQPESTALTTYSENWIAAQMEKPLSETQLNVQLLTLQTAFPTVVRNYDTSEFKAMQSLWYGIFKNVPEELMQEAIRRFIINDRKGFFPSPGQIVGNIEQIVREEKEQRDEIETQKHWARVAEYERLVSVGENCGNCSYCRREWAEPTLYDDGYDAFRRAWKESDKEKYLIEKLYCENPDSYNYEGDESWKAGTTAKKRCEHFTASVPLITAGGEDVDD